MKANEFVKENIWLLNDDMKEIKEIISDAKDYKFFCLNNHLGHSYDNHGGGIAISIDDLKRLVESWELVESYGGLERVKRAIEGRHVGYTHFYLHSNDRYVFLDHYVDFIPDHAQHIGMFNKAIADVESCQMEVG